MTPRFLDITEVLEIHQSRIDLYGGSHGVRDLGLLQSAIAQPSAGFGGQYLHADLFEMAAAYLFHIALNHPFVDGNKRTALAAALVFLEFNGVDFDSNEQEVEDITVLVAEGKLEKPQIADFFRSSSKKE